METQQTKEIEKERTPLWHDEDDDHVQVSLLKQNRTRKLRREEDENIISGSEFNKRLRLQYKWIDELMV